MGWLINKLNRWAVSSQSKELTEFVQKLSTMDGREIGFVVAMATDARHALEKEGHMVMDPIVYFPMNPGFPLSLSRTIIQLQKQGNPQAAAALMVWAHTMRVGANLELRQLGRDMWKELARGFPYVEDGAKDYQMLTGKVLNIEGTTNFPEGLTPDPI